MDGAGGASCERSCRFREDVKGGVAVCVAAGRKPRGGQDGFEFARADDRVYFGDILLDLVAVALDQEAGDYDALGLSSAGSADFFLHHLPARIYALLLG